jgi:ubiquinone biosynthesis accessory factor UbiJ
MLHTLFDSLGREALARVTLLLNHVIHAEPEAVRRLTGHVGRSVGVVWQKWPAFLPPPPAPVWRITPAGLLELDDDGVQTAPAGDEAATLIVTLDGSQLMSWVLSGASGRPPMDIRGDAGFAAEVSWLAENLRWDIEDDLARIVGDTPARALTRVASTAMGLVRGLAQRVPRPGASS